MKKFLVIMCCIAGLSFATAEVTAQRTVGNPSGEAKKKDKKVDKDKGENKGKDKKKDKKGHRNNSGNTAPKPTLANSEQLEELMITIEGLETLVDVMATRITELEGELESEVVTAMRMELDELKKMQNGEIITTENIKAEIEKHGVSKGTVRNELARLLSMWEPSKWDWFFRIITILLAIGLPFNFLRDYLNKQADEKLAKKLKEAGVDVSKG